MMSKISDLPVYKPVNDDCDIKHYKHKKVKQLKQFTSTDSKGSKVNVGDIVLIDKYLIGKNMMQGKEGKVIDINWLEDATVLFWNGDIKLYRRECFTLMKNKTK